MIDALLWLWLGTATYILFCALMDERGAPGMWIAVALVWPLFAIFLAFYILARAWVAAVELSIWLRRVWVWLRS